MNNFGSKERRSIRLKAIVNDMIVNLHAKPDTTSELVDEVLYGMTVNILEVLR